MKSRLIDSYNRKIDYLRISVTDRCNLRCIYCMPSDVVDWVSHSEILSYEEIIQLVKYATEIGICKIRITGGEPLVRKDVVSLIRKLSEIDNISDLSMTTNGTLLSKYAKELKHAGLKRVNISLDTLNKKKYWKITGGGKIEDVWGGIQEAQNVGLQPIKINVVIMRGVNDDEIVDFAKLTMNNPYYIRFIEFMPISRTWDERRFVPISEVKNRIKGLFSIDSVPGSGPAHYYKLNGAIGTLGFISPVSVNFCSNCNRLRLTSDGKLRPCLLSDTEVDVKPVLRNDPTPEGIKDLFVTAIKNKQLRYNNLPLVGHNLSMSQIGG
ncbi:MAG: GTP 3',8-cyclase MoaA [bacterium]|nr:GTP 3',8-cyclase MoaA [bacterium]